MVKSSRFLLAVFELLFACTVWGFGFIATRWAMALFPVFWLTAVRFLLAFLVCIFLLKPLLKQKSALKDLFRLAFIPGILLGLTLLFQTWGLETTTVTRSGFITTLYIVFVPIAEFLFLRKSLSLLHWLWVACALWGTAWMCQVDLGPPFLGDWLTLLCSLAATAHIVWLEVIAKRIDKPFVYNSVQSFWSGMTALPFALMLEPLPRLEWNAYAWLGMGSLVLGSTILAFAIQVRAQKILPASLVSMIFLLESPLAAFFAYLFMGETLTRTQGTGALLIFIASLGTLLSTPKNLRAKS